MKFKCLMVLSASIFLSSCAYMNKSESPTAGYIFVADRAYKGASSYKYYVAPESKAVIRLSSRTPVTNQVETNDFVSVSIAKAWPQGGVQYYTEAYACSLQAGTYVKKSSNSNDWDPRYETYPFGTVGWKIWKYVCEK